MESQMKQSLKLKFEPVATIWTDEKPEKALQYGKGKWGCVMFMLAAAAKGKTAVFDRETYGCFGGGVGLGFGNVYEAFPGGIECFCGFLSTGNSDTEKGRAIGEKIKEFGRDEFYEHFMHGEGYLSSPERTKKFFEGLPITDVPANYIVFKPLGEVDPSREKPVTVTYLVNPNQLSAMVILANYRRDTTDNVIIPYAAGCQTMGIHAYREARSQNQRAVIGLTDISARNYVKKQLGDDLLSITAPFEMALEMEGNVKGSFVEKDSWKALMEE